MKNKVTKNSFSSSVFIVIASLISTALGLYTLIEKKLVFFGKYTSYNGEIGTIPSILDAVSFFLAAIAILFLLSRSKWSLIVIQWLIALAILIFLSSPFFSQG